MEMPRVGKFAKVGGALLMAWWLLLLIGFGLFGNGYMASLALRAGSTVGSLAFIACFCGSGVYLYWTFRYRDQFRAILKD
jgi:hypothetical protein